MTDVLIVGAGPTGLVLALWLTRVGVPVRIIDKAREPGTTSRAIAVQARTLELYRQLGIAHEVVAGGLELSAVNLWVRAEQVGHVAFGDIGRGLSPFPYVLMFPQDEHERLLIEHLARAGVQVERRTELCGFDDRGDRIVARMRREGGRLLEEECEVAYLAGCDGAHSTVRDTLGIGFPGGTYERTFYVADAEVHGPVSNRQLHVALDEADFLAVFPMRAANAVRLIGTVRQEAEGQRELTWNDVSQSVVERMKLTIDRINWFSTYRVHHRVADRFRRGRAFLVGDAAHVHSPAGGQGMNTGIGDAVNLAWKLAAVRRLQAPAALLDTYEPERIAFAKRLVATTDRVFTFATKDGPLARRVRLEGVPVVVPALAKRDAVRRFMFRTVSQIVVSYHESDLSEGIAGSVCGGDRLPWTRLENADGGRDNYSPLTSVEWQAHVYGEAAADLAAACADRGLPLFTFPWQRSMDEIGLAEDALYLVRPDGYVALADAGAHAGRLLRYIDARGFKFALSTPRATS